MTVVSIRKVVVILPSNKILQYKCTTGSRKLNTPQNVWATVPVSSVNYRLLEYCYRPIIWKHTAQLYCGQWTVLQYEILTKLCLGKTRVVHVLLYSTNRILRKSVGH
jgi:hypothetical protein